MIFEVLTALSSSEGEVANSPFIVPVAGCAMIAAIVGFTSWSATRKRQIESEERLAAIARGVPVPPTLEELALSRNQPTPNAMRRRGNVRRGGIVMVSSAIGLALFFVVLWAVIGEREILSGAACALIPFGIGAGLLIDARIQTREIEEAAASSSTLYRQP
jgi:hypothetical protein